MGSLVRYNEMGMNEWMYEVSQVVRTGMKMKWYE
jgi:hypothetical protein